ncbi:MAG: hypothetical protein FD141_349 [Fusobacteria bacterium]|nr:MAG: hypothetical protein FD141_349 [Fusobacteriota bacterium]KAF0228986.1 MAG: hypothetical protein FD182_1242 [Fusobacteriota bacterium]
MENIKKRLKSPVVQIQLISIVVGVIIFFAPNVEQAVQVVSGALIAIINIVAGLNNPTDPENW